MRLDPTHIHLIYIVKEVEVYQQAHAILADTLIMDTLIAETERTELSA